MNAAKGMHWASKEEALREVSGMLSTLKTLWRKRDYAAAEVLAEKALQIGEMLELSSCKAFVLSGKAKAAAQQGQAEQAEEWMAQALAAAEDADVGIGHFPTLMQLFQSAAEAQKLSFILAVWERIKAHVNATEAATNLQARHLGMLGLTLANVRLSEEARNATELGLERARRIGNRLDTARLLRNLGWREMDLGHFEKSLTCAQEALSLTELGTNPNSQLITSRGDSLVLLAGVYEELCLFKEADKCYREALETIRMCKLSSEEAPCLNNHGVLLLILGRPDEAEQAFKASTRLKGGKLGKHSYAQFNMPEIYLQQGKLDLALEEIRRVLALWDEGEGMPLPRSQMVEGEVLSAMGRFREAEEAYYQAIYIVDSMGGNGKELATIKVGLGRNMARQGRLEDAAKELQMAADLFDRILGKSHPRLAVGLTVLAKVLLRLGQAAPARSCAERAVRMCEEVFGREHKEAVVARQAWELTDPSATAPAECAF